MWVLPPGYLKALKAHCEKRGMLLIIVDKAQAGISRGWNMFASTDFEGVVSEILTWSKTLGNRYFLSAVVTPTEIDRVARKRDCCFYTHPRQRPAAGYRGPQSSRYRLPRRPRHQRQEQCAGRFMLASAGSGTAMAVSAMSGVRDSCTGNEIVSDRNTKAPTNVELGTRLGEKMLELGL